MPAPIPPFHVRSIKSGTASGSGPFRDHPLFGEWERRLDAGLLPGGPGLSAEVRAQVLDMEAAMRRCGLLRG